MRAAQRSAVQQPRARRRNVSKKNDLAREAVGCNGVLARSALFLVTQEALVF
jgi:hypothetical protein